MASVIERIADTDVELIVSEGPADAPFLLFLHGIGSSARSFQDQLPFFSDLYRCEAWNAPGYGQSQPRKYSSMDEYAALVGQLIEQRAPGERIHLAGVSWGSVISAKLASSRPELLRSVTLASTSRGSAPTTGRYDSMRQRADVVTERGPAALYRERRAQMLDAGSADLGERVLDIATNDISVEGYLAAADAMMATDLTDALRRIDLPTLLVRGASDRVVTAGETAAVRDALGRPVEELHIEDAGHLVNQEAKVRFNEGLLAFLQSVDDEQAPTATPPSPAAVRD